MHGTATIIISGLQGVNVCMVRLESGLQGVNVQVTRG